MRHFRVSNTVGLISSVAGKLLPIKMAPLAIAVLAISLGMIVNSVPVSADIGDPVVILSGTNTATTYDFIVNSLVSPWESACSVTPTVDLASAWTNQKPAFEPGPHPWTGTNWISGSWIYAHSSNVFGVQDWSRYDVDVSGLTGSADIDYAGDNCTWVYVDGVLVDSFLEVIDANLGGGTCTSVDLTGKDDLSFILFDGHSQASLRFRVSGTAGPGTNTDYAALDGEIAHVGPVPSSLDHGLHQASHIQVFTENAGAVLNSAMVDDRGVTIAAGTYASYIIHFDNNGDGDAFAEASIEFNDSIVGIFHKNAGLYASDPIFGVAGVDDTQNFRRTGNGTPGDGQHDSFSVTDNLIEMDLKVDIGIDQIRVIVQGADNDGDGYIDSIDCDDTNPNIHPGATEVIDGEDNNCDGTVDERTAIDIDVKPESNVNPLHLNGNGVVPIAVLSTVEFDASSLLAGSVRTGADGAISAESVPGGHLEDVNADGLLDYVFHFREFELGVDGAPKTNVPVYLTAEDASGVGFIGVDTVRINPNSGKSKGKGGKGPK